MSKIIKQMQMASMKQTFEGIRDLVMMNVTGLDCHQDNKLRLTLRKKNIRLQVIKNSLARRVFSELGINLESSLAGPTTLAWGGSSVAELCKELDTLLKKNDKVKFKGAIADGQPITFEQGLKMPTRAEAIGRVLMLALSPARRIAGQIIGPASLVAGQIKSLSEKKEEAAPPEAGAPEAAPVPTA
jgi:large subunit ribosomal protein L10